VLAGCVRLNQFHGIVQLTDWKDYKDRKAVLITRTIFGDRDRLSGGWIAKSIPYTIEGPVVSMVTINDNQMRFVSGVKNRFEYIFAVIPSDIATSQIRNPGAVARLRGKY